MSILDLDQFSYSLSPMFLQDYSELSTRQLTSGCFCLQDRVRLQVSYYALLSCFKLLLTVYPWHFRFFDSEQFCLGTVHLQVSFAKSFFNDFKLHSLVKIWKSTSRYCTALKHKGMKLTTIKSTTLFQWTPTSPKLSAM